MFDSLGGLYATLQHV